MSFISYAQNFEDVMLWRALKHVGKGFYIDVGANDPNQDSVTKAFYERGWRGINIEPVPQWYEKLVNERPRDINLQIAAGSKKGELLLYEIPDTGLSTINKVIAEKHESERGYKKIERKVSVKTLTEICQEYPETCIHFLKIDVEGAEKQVLEGLNLSSIRPWIILIESTLPNTQIEDHEGWESILSAADYDHVYFDGLNRFYVAKEHQDIKRSFKAPPNIFDGFVLSETQTLCSNVAAKAKQAQTDLAELQAHSLSLQNELNITEKRLKALHKEKSEVLNHSTIKLAEEKIRAKVIQKEWKVAKLHLAKLINELATTKVNVDNLTAQLSKKSEALAISEASLLEQQNNSHSLQKEYDAIKAKTYELECKSHHWWLEADRLSNELQMVYNSRSWRITWPLRLFGRTLRWCLFLPIRFVRMVKRQVNKMLRSILLMAMRLILRRPGLKQMFSVIHKRFPLLYNRLRRLAENSGLLSRSHKINIEPINAFKNIGVKKDFGLNNGSSALKIEDDVDIFIERIYEEIKRRDSKV